MTGPAALSVYGRQIYASSESDTHITHEVIGRDCYDIAHLSQDISPKTIVDFGGHIGTFSILAAEAWPDAKIIVLEPNRDTFQALKMNVERFSHRVTAVNAAVSYSNKTLANHKLESWGGHLVDPETWPGQSGYSIVPYQIKSVTVEQVLLFCDGEIDLAKWDCEHGEIDAFMNMSDESARSFKHMVGEFHGGREQFMKLAKSRFKDHNWYFQDKPQIGYFTARPRTEAFKKI